MAEFSILSQFGPLLNETELSGILKISKSKLQKDRKKGGGIPFVVIGACIRYKAIDIMAFIEAKTVKSTSQVTVGA